jgi:hypothetical protein
MIVVDTLFLVSYVEIISNPRFRKWTMDCLVDLSGVHMHENRLNIWMWIKVSFFFQ